ncbi:eukaryotic translation initiation factor 4 gamma 1 isoform X1 [Octopus sinensis]|uniref:Eukaryotic translation initiation factor 4 gamma 1 isoform X1 n=2 Tax=Octopus sinensis TaxID=2607531 RepID=A0A6P7TF17_9MOLL|nr:eukaryotic translation initiation factor 4 gamma 1 isoform X1 [Octopus sinensis]
MEIVSDERTYTEDVSPDSKLQNSPQVYQKQNQHSLPNDMSKQGFVQQTRVAAASGVSSQQNMFPPQQNVRSQTSNYFNNNPQNVPNRNYAQLQQPRTTYVYGLPQTTQSYASSTLMSPTQVMPYASSGQRIPTPPFSNQPQQTFQMAAAATNQPFYPSAAPGAMYYPNYPMPRTQQRKRGSSKIKIVDPSTGKDISDEIRSTRQAPDGSGGGSGGGDMRAQFAAQVAATLKSQNQNFQLTSLQMPGGPVQQLPSHHQATSQIAQPPLAVQRPVTPQGQRRQTSKSPPGGQLESTNVMNVANFSGNPQKIPENSCIKYMPQMSSQAQDLVPNQPHTTPTQLSPPVSPPAQQTVSQPKHPPQMFKNSQPAHSLQIHPPPSQPASLQVCPMQQSQMSEQQPVQPRINTSMPQASKRGLSPATQVPSSVCQPQTLPHQPPQFIANSLPSQEIQQTYLQQKVSHEVIQNSLMAPVPSLQQQQFNSALDLENPEGIVKTESYNEVVYPAVSTSGALKKDDSPDRHLDDSSQLVAHPQPLLSKQPLPEALPPDTNQQEPVHTEAVKPVNIESDDVVNETKEEPLKKEQPPALNEEEKIEVDTEKNVVGGENISETKVVVDESESASVQPPPENSAEETTKDSKKEKTKVNETLNVGKTKEAENDNVEKPENTETEEVKDPVKQSETANVIEKEEKVAEEAKDVTSIVINIEDKVVADENEKNEAKNIEDAAEESDESILGYKYKDDQWSPLHPERKKQYDRDFLLKLQFANESVLMPLGLPDLPDVILTKPHEPERSFEKVPGSGSFESVFDFTPKYMRASKTTGNVRNIPKRGSQQGGARKEVKKITGVNLSTEVPLKRCDNAWRPTHKHNKEEEDDDEDDINKKVRSILNKLTPQKFEVLLSQIKEININTENKLKIVIGLLFEKAISEPSFSVAYANLCNCLVKIKVPSSSHQGTVNFRDTLLNRCQVEFEKHSSEEADLIKKQKELENADSDETKKRLKEELEEAFSAAKRRSIGNIRFIGELFKLNMLTEKIMHDCVSNLLKSRDEESLECLCRLLKTVGKEVDSDVSKGTMKIYFQQMKEIVSEKKTSSRVRFMLQDAIELRENNWVPRRAENNPKTIQQIHLEAAQEEKERKLLLENAAAKQRILHHRGVGNGASNTGMTPGPGVRASQGRVPSMGGAGGVEEGWTPVRSSKLDINKLRLPWKKNENVQLGPGGGNPAGWGRGSSGGLKGTQESSEKPVNRFYALSRNDDDSRTSIYPRRGASPGRSEIGRSLTSSSSASSSGSRNKISLQSEEGDKDSGLARNIHNRGSRTLSQVPSRESSQSREKSSKKTVEILNEFFSSNNLEEAKLSIQELSDQQKFVVDAFNLILERSEASRKQSGKLFSVILKEKIIEGKRFTQGLMEILEIAEDMQIDIPKIWQYLGELISPVIQAGGMPLSFLKMACEPLKKSNLGGILPSEILKDLCKTMGQDKAAELWQSSKLQWSDFLDEKDIDSFIKEKKLEYTLGGSVSKPVPGSLTIANIQSKLTELISKSEQSENEITAWIEAYVSEQQKKDPLVIRAIMTAVCSSCLSGPNFMPQEQKLRGYSSLLKKYLKNKDDEVQALYALQLLDTKLEHPPSVLKKLFVILYEEVISKQAFISWGTASEPAEMEGRGVALKQVSHFLHDLEKVDDDEEIDADDS